MGRNNSLLCGRYPRPQSTAYFRNNRACCNCCCFYDAGIKQQFTGSCYSIAYSRNIANTGIFDKPSQNGQICSISCHIRIYERCRGYNYNSANKSSYGTQSNVFYCFYSNVAASQHFNIKPRCSFYRHCDIAYCLCNTQKD